MPQGASYDDLRSFLDPETLILPIGGTRYVVKPCDGETWLRLHAHFNQMLDIMKSGDINADAEGDDSLEEFAKKTIGHDVFAKMVKDKVTGRELSRAAWTAFYWQLEFEELSKNYWVNGGKALTEPPPNRAARRAKTSARPATAASQRVAAKRPTAPRRSAG